ncbi:MAG: biotin--[acetyl-CoA-carboxylase] ligase [Acidiferrobacteraceae bacterium]|nr:biotin--[acetyl-CoA-carboxylase] ligase [Acidiferrobacteraceae bacterium]
MNDLRSVVRLLSRQQWTTEKKIRDTLSYSDIGLKDAIDILLLRGLHVESHPKYGFRLRKDVTLIDEQKLKKLLGEAELVCAKRLSVLDAVDSTNDLLLSWGDITTLHGRVFIAEFQDKGRGRDGRLWQAAGYQNLTLSLAWATHLSGIKLPAFSLVAALALCICLDNMGYEKIGLKWPNDVMLPSGKLAGILVETNRRLSSNVFIVVGVGLNVRMSTSINHVAKQPVCDLESVSSSTVAIDRTLLAANLIASMSEAFDQMERLGFRSFMENWNDRDIFRDREVVGTNGDQRIIGCGMGVDQYGAYLVRDELGRVHKLVSGEARLR